MKQKRPKKQPVYACVLLGHCLLLLELVLKGIMANDILKEIVGCFHVWIFQRF